MSKKLKVIHVSILVLTFEKMLQHLLTTVFFVVDIPGIGRPEIGPTFQFSAATRAILNLIVFISVWCKFMGQAGWQALAQAIISRPGRFRHPG